MQNLVADLSICQEAFKKGIKIETVNEDGIEEDENGICKVNY
jgi:hypothetical protein